MQELSSEHAPSRDDAGEQRPPNLVGIDLASVAFFCSATENYVPQAALALLSVKRWHPECSYFILADTKRLSREAVDLIESLSLRVLPFEGETPFTELVPEWPLECYFILKGPELLYRLGYKYSVSIDGDVYCRRPLDLHQILPSLKGWGGVGVFPRNPDNRTRKFIGDLVKERFVDNVYVNTGVLFWNNRRLSEFGFFEWCCTVYRACVEKGYTPPSDQQLFDIAICRKDVEFLALPDGYNFRVCKPYTQVRVLDQALHAAVRRKQYAELVFVHFVFCPKPWQPSVPDFCSSKNLLWLDSAAHFYMEWQEFIKECLGPARAERMFGECVHWQLEGRKDVGGYPASILTYLLASTITSLEAFVEALVSVGRK